MLVICDDYAYDYSISVDASKSKCLVVLPGNRRCLNDYVRKCTFYVGDNHIEYVDSFVHLGHVITNQLAVMTTFLEDVTILLVRLIMVFVSSVN